MPTLPLKIIGRVHCPVTVQRDQDWGDVVSQVVLEPVYQGGLVGLDGFSHVMVVTYLHEAAFEVSRHLVRRPRGLESMPLVGIFSQRAKDRPNPIGITAVRVKSVAEGSLDVVGLDAIDGTPVLDLKPYYPHYDRVADATVPAWVDELMKGYF
jgi:tRNA (adenine37-N6)-methyltransferase